MSEFRRRMMMKAKEQQSSVEDLDYLTIIPLHEEEGEYRLYPYRGSNAGIGDIYQSYVQALPFYYRLNMGEWKEVFMPDAEDLRFSIALKKGDSLQLKCMGADFDWSYFYSYCFLIQSECLHAVSGTPMSLLYGDDFKLFDTAIENLISLFEGNTGLVEILNPNTFLPYTDVSPGAYDRMFASCSNLVNAPELPATMLSSWCYGNMFSFCTSLIKAPELPATTLAESCYYQMFYGCTKLNYIKMLASDISALYCLEDWVYGVSPTGTFVKSKDATWDVVGDSGVPAGWTVITNDQESGG